jgi:nicotinamidase/pyrazinamidase
VNRRRRQRIIELQETLRGCIAVPTYGPTTALLVVDLQNDFADPAGSLYVQGGEEVVPIANREIERAKEAGALIVYTQDWHPPHTPHFAQDGGVWPVHCVQGSWGAEFHPALEVHGEVVQKGTGGEDGYSGFTVRDPISGEEDETLLGTILRRHGIEHVVIVGLATDYCVKDTSIDAVNKGFRATVLSQGVRAVNLNPTDGDRALEDMRRAGVTVE